MNTKDCLTLLAQLVLEAEKRLSQVKGIKYKTQLKFISPLLIVGIWAVTATVGIAQQPPRQSAVTVQPVSQSIPASPPIKPGAPSESKLLYSGTTVSLNGRTMPAAWQQWQSHANDSKIHTALSDAGVMQLLGVELLSTKAIAAQPVQWFSQPTASPFILESWHNGGYRYLDITQLATLGAWQLSVEGGVLRITTPIAKVQAVRLGKQVWGTRIVIDLDRPTLWQVSQQVAPSKPKLPLPNFNLQNLIPQLQPPKQEWLITIDGAADPTLITTINDHQPLLKLEAAPNLTSLRLSLPVGLSPHVSTLPHPNRLIIDLRPDAMVERDILWAQGLRWRQQFVNLGDSRFPVIWLEIAPGVKGLTLKPIWSETSSLVGTAPILKTAQRYGAVAAINGGFFNRNNKLPLGAIRQDGRWLSSPILNRGAIAWNEAGQIKIARLNVQETLITSAGKRLPVLTFNSGYVKSGIARYNSDWGRTYTPLIDHEIIIVVQNNQVTAQIPGGVANQMAIPIPFNGYLLTIRGNNAATNFLPIGTLVRQESASVPNEFASYPDILGAGPLLVQNRQIVLDAKAEGFSDAFLQEKAPRSTVCKTAAGNLMIMAVHNRVGGDGPTLVEIAQVMQQLGCVDALNLDGGSSTSLYLGGQLLNRSPLTAARVHNGIGVFLSPSP